MKYFYCEVICRATGKTLATYTGIRADDWYYARHIAADRYRKEHNLLMCNAQWYIDSLETTEAGELID